MSNTNLALSSKNNKRVTEQILSYETRYAYRCRHVGVLV